MSDRFEIYMVEDPDGRRYVGCTGKTAAYRWAQHTAGFRDWHGDDVAEIHDGIRRYGKAAFKLTVLMVVFTREDAAYFEAFMIERMGSLRPHGYNVNAKSNFPRKPSTAPHWRTRRAA